MEGWKLYALGGRDQMTAKARELEAEVFEEAFGNTVLELTDEYAPYEQITSFLRLTGPDGDVGMVRMLLGQARELKSIKDAAQAPWGLDIETLLSQAPFSNHPDRVLDVATLAVAPRHRQSSGAATLALCAGIIRCCSLAEATLAVAVLDTKVLSLLNRMFCGAWRPYPGAQAAPYLGSSSSIPATCDLIELRALLHEQRPETHRGIYLSEAAQPKFPALELERSAMGMLKR